MIRTTDPKSLTIRHPFSTLFTVEPHVLDAITENMATDGYDYSKPIDVWAEEGIVVDGHTRLAAALVEVVGYLPNYLTITGFSVTPVVGFVRPEFDPAPDITEVSEAFEVPLDILLAPGNMQLRHKRFMGVRLPYYEMPWGEHRIWGATAAMLVNFRDTLRGGQA